MLLFKCYHVENYLLKPSVNLFFVLYILLVTFLYFPFRRNLTFHDVNSDLISRLKSPTTHYFLPVVKGLSYINLFIPTPPCENMVGVILKHNDISTVSVLVSSWKTVEKLQIISN